MLQHLDFSDCFVVTHMYQEIVVQSTTGIAEKMVRPLKSTNTVI